MLAITMQEDSNLSASVIYDHLYAQEMGQWLLAGLVQQQLSLYSYMGQYLAYGEQAVLKWLITGLSVEGTGVQITVYKPWFQKQGYKIMHIEATVDINISGASISTMWLWFCKLFCQIITTAPCISKVRNGLKQYATQRFSGQC